MKVIQGVNYEYQRGGQFRGDYPYVEKYVRRIRDKAGITGKELTYHCSRHTAATLAISAGAELYSVSKILGHRNLVSTQVYAKVNLEKKMEAVNLANGVLG